MDYNNYELCARFKIFLCSAPTSARVAQGPARQHAVTGSPRSCRRYGQVESNLGPANAILTVGVVPV